MSDIKNMPEPELVDLEPFDDQEEGDQGQKTVTVEFREVDGQLQQVAQSVEGAIGFANVEGSK